MIRPVDLTHDLDHLVALERACFGDEAWSRAGLAGALTAPGNLTLVSQPGDCPVDGVALWARVADEAELLRLAVAPAARRCGLGRALLVSAIDQLTNLGTTRLLLEVRADNTAAIALYLETGWQLDGKRLGYYRDGTDALLFSRLNLEPRDSHPKSLVDRACGRIPSR